ncbi:hypothetical protein CALCODRAFT_48677 [Calocera cornea HHB12733]|uniref:Uncharacterized protein n=1 Tax=Calocera cornea HHB12733 TaxID=1353952 RepID=A0A165DUC0_9BASI|nr:hypothetical protein CALCODRAFT_48677 [Calocera cornea HHB12733]
MRREVYTAGRMTQGCRMGTMPMRGVRTVWLTGVWRRISSRGRSRDASIARKRDKSHTPCGMVSANGARG